MYTFLFCLIMFFTGCTAISLFMIQREVSAMRDALSKPLNIVLPKDAVNVHVLNAVKLADNPLPVSIDQTLGEALEQAPPRVPSKTARGKK